MSAKVKADGDTWEAKLGGRVGSRVVVFLCVTTDQRPYRVVSVGDGLATQDDLEALPGVEVDELFARSRSMGAPTEYPTYRG